MSPEMFGFKSPTGVKTELQKELLQYDPHLELQKFESLQAQYPNNQDQQHVFDAILEAAHVGRKTFFFIDGPGGTGKTRIIKKVITKLRSEGKVVQVCASTTLAATLYENATTAHSLFKYPVEDEHSKDSEQRSCYNRQHTAHSTQHTKHRLPIYNNDELRRELMLDWLIDGKREL